jgi:hypothetical protein
MPSSARLRTSCRGSVPSARRVPISRVRSMMAMAIALVTTKTTMTPMISPARRRCGCTDRARCGRRRPGPARSAPACAGYAACHALAQHFGEIHAVAGTRPGWTRAATQQLLRGGDVGVDRRACRCRARRWKTRPTVTSSAFSAPSVVLASSVRLLPGCGLQAARQALAQHHLGSRRARGQHLAGAHLQERALDRELAVGLDAGGQHHGGLVAVADQAAELHARQHLAHLRGRPAAGLRGRAWSSRPCCSGVSSSWLNCAGVPSIRWPVVRAAAWASALVGEQRKAAGQQDGRGAQRGDGHRHRRAARLRRVLCTANLKPGKVAPKLAATSLQLLEFSRPAAPARGRSGGSGGCRGWR